AELGLETTRVRPDAHGFVAVDERCRTADPRIWAVGDVTGEPMLAHRAMRQGKVAAEAIAGRPAAFDTVVVPAVVFTDPEVAWCGLTESQALREGRPVRIAKFQWAASGRAATLGRSDGRTGAASARARRAARSCPCTTPTPRHGSRHSSPRPTRLPSSTWGSPPAARG